MAFDFQRALSLGRQALRLVETFRGSGAAPDDDASRAGSARRSGGRADAAGGRQFDLRVPPREGAAVDPGAFDPGAFDPTDPTQCWPQPGTGGTRPTSEGARTSPEGRTLLPDFTGRARVEYAPVPGPTPDPGEVVWTWVPFEEMDGRGKDRPVLLVGRDGAHLLGVMLTSREHTTGPRRDADYVDVGSGPWDRQGRASEAKLDRVLRVDPATVRRDGGVLDPVRFEAVGDALARVQGWER